MVTPELYVEEHGEGAPLLLIQGLGWGVWAARRQIPAFAAVRRVIAFDNRGTGRSFTPPGPYSIGLLAEDAASVLDERRVSEADVLGHSMGGYIALTLAATRPELVRSLVLVGTGPGGPEHEETPRETRKLWLSCAGLPLEENIRLTLPVSFAETWLATHAREYEEILAARIDNVTPPECWRAQYDACGRYREAGPPIERIDVPALVVHGEDDRVVPVSNGRVLARRLPQAELVVLEGVGHAPTLEAPETFNGLVLEFLARVDRAGTARTAPPSSSIGRASAAGRTGCG